MLINALIPPVWWRLNFGWISASANITLHSCTVFRTHTVLQVGYGLLMDLKAIATAIGGEGVGCVSVVQPYIDVKTLHRQLSAGNIPGIGKVH